MIPVELFDDITSLEYDKVRTVIPSGPGIPLDEDIFDGLLQQLRLYNEVSDSSYGDVTNMKEYFDAKTTIALNIETLYMEVQWRKIQKTRNSGT